MRVACALIHESALLEACEERSLPAEDLWEEVLRALEGIGAAVESDRAGEAFFGVQGLRGIHGGDVLGVMAAARRALEGTGVAARLAAAPTRFAAYAAASRGRALVSMADLRAFLDPLPTGLLARRLGLSDRGAAELAATLEKLGIGDLARLRRLSAGQVADRFGLAGSAALRLAQGEDGRLRPRPPHEELVEEIELPDGTVGRQLERALELLVDRLLAAPQRRDRTVLGLRLGAILCGGGSWSVDQGLGRPTASAQTMRSLLLPRLASLPRPALSLRLRAVSLGPPAADQLEFSICGREPRRRRLGAALREIRSAQGAEALLRVLPVDAASRVPERWAMLTPAADR
jgi:protein ImuB